MHQEQIRQKELRSQVELEVRQALAALESTEQQVQVAEQAMVLAEEELAFMAQDRDGNVWSLGEYPEEHADDGSISAPRTWLHGKQGATAGVLMREDPRPNTSSMSEKPRYHSTGLPPRRAIALGLPASSVNMLTPGL